MAGRAVSWELGEDGGVPREEQRLGLKSRQGHSQVIPYSPDSPAEDQPIPSLRPLPTFLLVLLSHVTVPLLRQLPPIMDAAAQLYLLGDRDCTLLITSFSSWGWGLGGTTAPPCSTGLGLTSIARAKPGGRHRLSCFGVLGCGTTGQGCREGKHYWKADRESKAHHSYRQVTWEAGTGL